MWDKKEEEEEEKEEDKDEERNEVEEMGETKKKDQRFYLWLDESITCRPDIYDP